MPRIPDKCRLLHGPYRQLRLYVGDRTDCNRRGTVKITSWTAAHISWPRCLPVASKGHPSLLLDNELARAVRTESAAAICYWWGVSISVVARFRKALDVTQTNNPRTHQLMVEACRAGAEAIKAMEWTDEERDAKRRLAARLNLGQHLQPGFHGPWWSEDELELLGTLPDGEVARRTGRTVEGVRIKREKMGLPNPESRAWTADELSQLGTATDAKIADRLGRTASAVYQKRLALGIPPARRKGRAGMLPSRVTHRPADR